MSQLASEPNEKTVRLAGETRPWGGYEVLIPGEQVLVKVIRINPGKRLSLQSHRHRAEHWFILDGVAEVVCGDERATLAQGETIYIPLGAVHRLENPGPGALKILEVQSGKYLSEDDIVRYEDDFGRHKTEAFTSEI